MLWGIRPVEQKAAYGLAVDRLRQQIHSGLLLPLEKLPAERDLSERFRISRVTLREALRVLESDKYITVKRGAQGGAFVTDADRLAELAHRRISRAPAAAMRMLEFLTVNQIAAARHAATRRSPAELKRLHDAVDMMEDATSAAHLKQAETLFHMAVGEATRNAMLVRAIEEGLAELFLPVVQPAQDVSAPETIIFRSLLAGIEAENPVQAETAMAALHKNLWEFVRRVVRLAA